jgi:uncharacterized membrane protein YfcA
VDIATAALLAGAGLVGGVANAIAGGATLITFPAMLASGIPPVIANASNAVAVTPGHFIAAIADLARIPAFDRRFLLLIVLSLVGAAIGAVLLLVTTDRTFILLVPLLVGAATLIFAFSRKIQKAISERKRSGRKRGKSRAFLGEMLIVPTTIYGGYFGGGLGVMLLAILGVMGVRDVRAANVMKNLLATAVSAVTIAIFIGKGIVDWPHTLVMLVGAACGGFLGGWLVRVLPPAAVRGTVIAAGTVITLYYAWRYWF